MPRRFSLYRFSLLTPLVALFPFTATLVPAPAMAQNVRYDEHKVTSISINIQHMPKGASFDRNTVLNRLLTKQGELFSQTDFDADLKLLARDYDRVEPTVVPTPDGLAITLELWPAPTIRSINWIGVHKLRVSNLRKELGIKAGEKLDRHTLSKAFHDVKTYVVKRGLFEAELEYKLRPDPESNDVDLDITVNEGRSGRIEKLEFEGFTKQEESDILDMVMTTKYNLFTSFLTGDGTYQQEVVQQDQLIILNYLQSHGYADANVTIDIVESPKNNRIILLVKARRGPHYHFGTVTITGNEIFTLEELQPFISVKQDSVFSSEALRNTADGIQAYYGSKGYIDAFVTFDPHLDPSKPIYNVDITIEEGNQYRVGMINVYGNTCTQARVILHESLLVPGEVFNSQKLQQTEQKLRNIGYFENVNVYAVSASESNGLNENFRDVNIEVEEMSTGSLSAFSGFSTLESIFGGIQLTERNFNYRGIFQAGTEGWTAIRGGGEYAHITLTIGKKTNSYVLSWAKPFFCDTRWLCGFDIDYSSNRVTTSYDINSYGIQTYAKYPINQYLRFGTHYRFRNSDVTVPSDSSPRQIQEANNSGIISGIGTSLVYDSTDSARSPTCGFRSNLILEYVGLGGNHTFGSINYINTYYYPVNDDSIFKLRFDTRFVIPAFDTTLSTLPVDERFFLGGDTSVRGYRAYSLGPKYYGTEDPTGGLSSTFFSMEYLYHVLDSFGVFAFFDAGCISDKEFDIRNVRSSWGYGARISLNNNMPPIIIGMGYPINKVSESNEKKFFLSVGAAF